MEIITKFKIFEIKNDLDPYDEEDWEDNNNLYVIYVIGQDSHFLAKKKERIINDRQGNWKDYYYVVATKKENIFYFDFDIIGYVNDPYPVQNVDNILKGKELVGYIENFGIVKYDTLQNMCDILSVNIEDINMYEN